MNKPVDLAIRISSLSEEILKNVLVVDDEAPIRIMIQEILEDSHYAVKTAASAEEALELIKKEDFGVILSDIRMAGMSGVELLKKIKVKGAAVPVIIMTSYASLDATIEVLKAGAFDFLIKPFDELDFVVNAVDRAVAHYRLVLEKERLITNLAMKNKEMERVIYHLSVLAIVDGLTGLFNYRHLQELLARELARSERHNNECSVIFLDIDHFKKFNDTLGHEAGNLLLKEIAQLFREELRKNDIIARYGGEEFVFILPEIDKETAFSIAEKVRKLVEEREFLAGDSFGPQHVTVSAGVSAYREDGTENELLLKAADKALFDAKQSGRNRVSKA
ncbi:MAG: diguanylate cyclase [Gammaproteobacteria bacterium]|nr:diguanylate cyclase [Gammaproteobacteria bacterium]